MNDRYLIANLNVNINDRQTVAQRQANEVYVGKMAILAAIRESLSPKVEKEYDTTPHNGRHSTVAEYTFGTI